MGDGGRVGESLRDGDVEVAAETVVVEVCPVGGEDLVGEDADGDWTEVELEVDEGPGCDAASSCAVGEVVGADVVVACGWIVRAVAAD